MFKRVIGGVLIGGLYVVGGVIIKKLNELTIDVNDIKRYEGIPDTTYQNNQLTAFVRSLYEIVDDEEEL